MKHIQNKGKKLVIITLIIIFFLGFFSASFGETLKKGFPAPKFTLNSIDGETINLEDYKEKQALLILYFCNNENKDSVCGIEELSQYFEEHIINEKYQVILINTHKDIKEEDIALIKEFWTNKKISFSILLDSQNEVSKLYNIEVLPTTIFLDKNLIVKRIYPGLISKQQSLMFQYITYLLDSKEKGDAKKDGEGDEGCNGPCPPPPGY